MPRLIAHRGASYDAPENTLAAIRLAWEQGADGVEIDVHLSRDGHIVVIHDADLRRTCRDLAQVSECDWEELALADAGSWRGPQWSAERLPRLADVLDLVPAGRPLFVEVKCGVEVLTALLRLRHERSERFDSALVLMSFDVEVTVALRRAFADCAVFQLHAWDKHAVAPFAQQAAELGEQARQRGCVGVDVGLDARLDESIIAAWHDAGLQVGVWTVDAVDDARRLSRAGVDYLTTNRPQWLREQLRS